MDLIKKYNNVRTVLSNTPSNIDTYVPVPSNIDYERGYITRFFIQQSNDTESPIYEISKQNFRKYSTSKLYRGTTLRWRIKGPLEPIFNNRNEVTDKGVRESNKIAIQIASEKIKNLKLYLPHLLQFYKE